MKKDAKKPHPLELTWETIHQDDGTGFSLAHITLKNVSLDTIFQSDWAIYFNAGVIRVHESDSLLASIEMVNGDFFRLAPEAGWTPLAPGSSHALKVRSRMVKNFTDLPTGFYYVAEKWTEGTDIPFSANTPAYADSLEWELAKKYYVQNEQIDDIPLDSLPPVFPTPLHYTYNHDIFILDSRCTVVGEADFGSEAQFLKDELEKITGVATTTTEEAGAKSILLRKKEGIADEGYELTVNEKEILVEASTPSGIFYGIQTLINLIPASDWSGKQPSVRIKGVHVVDAPRFGHRALMLDVSRNFQQKGQIVKVLDMMAMYKLNVLHFHLNDDEGWRLEIPGLSELTDVGGHRGHSLDERQQILPSYGSGSQRDNVTGSGYYTREEYIDILQYASRRHIRVIPEIETPGHARAAIKAMDARYENLVSQGDTVGAREYLLRDPDDKSRFRSIQNWDDNVIDVSLPSTYTFLEKVTDELILMYREADASLETIHFGGDEVPEGVWEKSPAVEKLLVSRPDILHVDELWHYYFDRIDNMLTNRGLYLSGWEEIGMKKDVVNGQRKMVVEPRFGARNFHVDVWNNLGENEDLAYRLANAGYQVVLTNVTNFYFDLAYSSSYYEPGQYWGGYVDIDKPFRFIPYNYYRNQVDYTTDKPIDVSRYANRERLTEEGKKNIVGIQAPLWSEKITSPERMEYLLLPKLFGLAERAWSSSPAWDSEQNEAMSSDIFRNSWSIFINTVGKKELIKLDYYNSGYAYRIPPVGVRLEGSKVFANTQIPGLTIRYTTDETEPSAESDVFVQGMDVSQVGSLRAFNNEGRGGRTIRIQQ